MNWEGFGCFIETGQQWCGPVQLKRSIEIGIGRFRVHFMWVAE